MYSTVITPTLLTTILTSCNKGRLLLGCRSVGQSILSVAAIGNRADVLYNCSLEEICPHIANDVAWYFQSSSAWGFTRASDPIQLASCDTMSTDPNYRLCWHINSGDGYRCGNTILLNSDSAWERVIYQAR